MNRNAVAIASSVLFVVFAAVIVLVPAPYVTWRPGVPIDVYGESGQGPVLQIAGAETHEPAGQLLMTLVSTSKASATVSLPEAMLAYYAKGSDAMPRELIYPAGKSEAEITQEAVASMDTSRNNAIVAALRAAGIPVTEHPMIAAVVTNGPAGEKLQPGDLIVEVEGVAVDSPDAVVQAVQRLTPGRPISFTILRGAERITVAVTSVASSQDSRRAVIGVNLGVGYEYAPTVTYGLSDDVVGPSAGLVFALGLYDKLTTGDLVGDQVVAGTGEIDPSGQVRAIGGVQEKMKGAEDAGAGVFLMPRENCANAASYETDMRLVPVSTLRDAIAALQFIQEGNESEVPRCE